MGKFTTSPEARVAPSTALLNGIRFAPMPQIVMPLNCLTCSTIPPGPITHPVHSFTNPTISHMGTQLPSEPSAAMLNLSALAYLLGVTVITWCITRTSEKHSLSTSKAWKAMPWARICFLLVLIDSWLYLIMTGVLLHGAPRQHEPHRCSIGIVMCLICYVSIKGLVYLCLIERVRAVWSTTRQRWRSPIYLFCFSLLLPLIGMVAGMLISQAIHYLHNGYCVLGITRLSSILLLSYDICINLFLTVMFVAPLIHYCITYRTGQTSTNGVIVYVLDGNETIWVCLGSCAADIVINAVVLYWVFKGLESPQPLGRKEYIFRRSAASLPSK
ncbi:hypothetical protein B0J17DRAFT_765396 [Rhizoctonia solani]|nr:hypothetical protein B0J17DRAFT_765396 [Rhizoctonia solani]